MFFQGNCLRGETVLHLSDKLKFRHLLPSCADKSPVEHSRVN